jgi:hypothetical protein
MEIAAKDLAASDDETLLGARHTWSRAEGSEKTTQAGALIIVVGAFLLGLSIFVSHGK